MTHQDYNEWYITIGDLLFEEQFTKKGRMKTIGEVTQYFKGYKA